MTLDELRAARAAAWRQDGRPLVTGEDAAAWLRETGLALLRPRPKEMQAPAPSLVEALNGAPDAEPGLAALEGAKRLLPRLDAVPLLLLGGAQGVGHAADEPDFLASEETFPFVYALRGDRDWARGPRGKSSPLEGAAWTLLGERGPLTAGEVKDALGKQLSESAALRALGALWAGLRVEPVYGDGETRWRRIEAARADAMAAGAALGQAAALSGLLSVYLQAAVAAAGEEAEAFLAPVASRARVRDALRGLTAARQLGVRALGAREHFYVEGSLPVFGEAAPAQVFTAPVQAAPLPPVVVEGEDSGPFQIEAVEVERAPASAKRGPAAPFFAREPWREDRRGARPNPGAGKRAYGPGAGAGSERRPPREGGSDRRTFGGAAARERPSGEGRPSHGGRGENRFGAGLADKSPDQRFGPPGRDGERRPFAPRQADGERRPVRADGGKRPSFAPPPAKQRSERESARGGGPSARPYGQNGPERFGVDRDQKPWNKRAGGAGAPRPGPDARQRTQGEDQARSWEKPDRRPFARREDGEAKPFRPRAGGSGFRPEGAGPKRLDAPTGARPVPYREARAPFHPEAAGGHEGEARGKRPYAPRGGDAPEKRFGGARPPKRQGEERPVSRGGFPGSASRGEAQGGRRPVRENGGGPNRYNAEGADRPAVSSRRYGAESGAAAPRRYGANSGPGAKSAGRPGGKKPRTAPFTSTGKPRPGVGKPGRPGPKAGRKPFGTGPKRDG